jgi:hypothetical protein
MRASSNLSKSKELASGSGRVPHQLPQHERQNPSMLVVIDFDRRVDADDQRDVFRRSVRAMNDQRRFLARAEIASDSGDVERLGAVESQRQRYVATVAP